MRCIIILYNGAFPVRNTHLRDAMDPARHRDWCVYIINNIILCYAAVVIPTLVSKTGTSNWKSSRNIGLFYDRHHCPRHWNIALFLTPLLQRLKCRYITNTILLYIMLTYSHMGTILYVLGSFDSAHPGSSGAHMRKRIIYST